MADIRIIPSIGAINVTGSAEFRGESGTSLLYLSGSGLIGVGTTVPQSELHVVSAGTRFFTLERSGVRSFDLGVNSSGTFLLTDNTATADRIALNESGSVGIGTTNPSEVLQVIGNIRSTYNSSNFSRIGQNSSGGYIQAYSGNVEKIMLRSYGASFFNGGSVGIGTDSPSDKLHIQEGDIRVDDSNNGTVRGLYLRHSGITGNVTSLVQDTSGSPRAHLKSSERSLWISAQSNGGGVSTETLRLYNNQNLGLAVDYSGSVGIGTTNPTTILHVYRGGTGIAYDLTLQSGDDATGARHGILFRGGPANYEALIRTGNYGSYKSNLEFWVSNQTSGGSTLVQALSILSAGDVRLNEYGSGTFTGTAAYNLSIDSTGKIIETANPSLTGTGTTNYVTKWSGTNSLTDSVMYDDGTNIGIGTNSPQSPLDVRSSANVLITATSTDAGAKIKLSDTDSDVFIQNQSSTLSLGFSSTQNGQILHVSSSGNVGIGSTAPEGKLNVVGGADVLIVEGSGSTSNTTLMAVDGNNGRLFEVSDDLSDSLFSVNTIAGLPVMEAFADNVVTLGAYNQYDLHITGSRAGIGTSAPEQKLDVRGNAYFSGSVGIGTVSPFAGTELDVWGDITLAQQNWTLRGNNANADLAIEELIGSSFSDANIRLYLQAGGNVGIGTTTLNNKFTVQGGTSLRGGVNVTQAGYSDSGSTVDIIVDSQQPKIYSSYWSGTEQNLQLGTYSQQNLLTLTTGSNVGIGKTNPGQKLDVSGNIAANTIYLYDSTSNDRNVLDLDASDNLQVSTGTSTGARSITFFTENTEQMRINALGSVGIGTSSPVTKLDVAGNISITGSNPTYYVTRGDGTYVPILQLESSTDDVLVGFTSIDALRLYDDSGEVVRLDGTGKVGIGITNPGAILDVNHPDGTTNVIRVSSGSGNYRFRVDQFFDMYMTNGSGTDRLAIKNDGTIYAPNLGTDTDNTVVVLNSSGYLKTDEIDSRVWGSSLVDGSGTANRVAYWSDADTLTSDADFFFDGTSVGVGTTSPNARLEVNTTETGSSENGIALRYGANQVHYWNLADQWTSRFQIGSTAGNWRWDNSGGTRMVIKSDGNVGIGTDSPGTILHLKDSGTPTILFEASSGATQTAKILYDQSGQNKLVISTQYQSATDENLIQFAPADSVAMTIRGGTGSSNGFVGIGTTLPDTMLHVVGDTKFVGDMTVDGILTAREFHTTFVSASIVFQSGSTIFGNSNDDTHEFYGTVGITGTSEQNYLEVDGMSGFAGLTSGSGAMVRFLNAGDGNNLFIRTLNSARTDAAPLAVWTDNNPRFIIRNDGKVGIGTTNPAGKLHVEHNQTAESNVIFMNNNTGANAAMRLSMNVGNPAGNDPMVSFNIGDGGYDWTIGVDNSDGDSFKISGGIDSHNPSLGTNDRLKISGAGLVTAIEGFAAGGQTVYNNTGADSGAGIANGFTASLQPGVNTMSVQYQYRFYLTTMGTGTYSGATYILYYNGSNWVAREVSRSGTSSNHPEMTTSGNAAIIYDDHASGYSVHYRVESYYRGNNNTSLHTFGSDYHWQRTGDLLTYVDGRVGIGTSSPDYELTVEDTIGIKRSGVNAISTLQQTGAGLEVNAPDGYHPLIIKHNGTEYARFRNDGNVGIGLTNPGRLLHVSGSSTVLASFHTNYALSSGFADIFEILDSDMTGGGLSFNIGKSNSSKNLGKLVFNYAGNSSNSNFLGLGFYDADYILNVTAGGNVGIGTTNPAATLDIANSQPLLRLTNTEDKTWSSGQNISKIDFYTKDSSSPNGTKIAAYIQNINDVASSVPAGALAFGTSPGGGASVAATEAMRISGHSGGMVGIGTSSPSYKLHVDANTGALFRVSNGAPLTYFQTSYYGYASSYEVAQIGDWYGKNSSGVAVAIGIDPKLITGGAFFGNEVALPDFTEFITANAPSGSATDWNQNVLVISGSSIGIGVAAPTTKLDVNGSALVRSGLSLSATTTTLSPGELWFPTGGTIGISGTGGSLNILTAGQSETLAINGTISASGLIYAPSIGTGTDDSVVILDSDGTLRTDEIDSRVWGSSLVDGSGTANYIPKWSDSDTLTNSVLYDNNGLIGVGTTSPNFDIDIRRTKIGDSSRLRVRNDDGTNTGSDAYINIATVAGDPFIQFDYGGSTIYSIGIDNSDGDKFKISNGSSTYKPGDNDLVTITSGGNVGIGTESPAASLHIHGDGDAIRVTNTNAGAGGAQIDLLHFSPSPADNDTMAYLNMGGYYSGTNSAYFTSIRTVATDVDGRKGELQFWTSNGGAVAPQVVINAPGNVGIGTDSPSEKLHLYNSTAYATSLIKGTDANLASSYALEHGGGGGRTEVDGTWNMSYGSAETNFGLTPNLGGGMVFWFNSGSTYETPMVLKRNGDALFSGNLGIGKSGASATLDVQGNAIFRVTDSSNTTGGFTITNDDSSPTAASWTFDSNPVFLVTSDNPANPHIGINQSSNDSNPAKIIGYKSRGDTNANANVANGDEIFQIQAFALHTSGPNYYKPGGDMTWYKDDNGGTANTYAPMSLRWRLALNTTTLHTPMTLLYNGNLGLGTTTPQSILHISAPKPTYTDSAVVFRGGTTNNNSHTGITLTSAGDALTGGVGSNYLVDGTSQSQSNTNRSTGYIRFANTTVASKTSTIDIGGFVKGTTTDVSRLFIDGDGNVGIGTDSPSHKLHVVAGTSSIALSEYNSGAIIWMDGSNGDFTGGDYFNIYTPDETRTSIGYVGGEALTVTSGSYVGIGTTSPAYKLDVTGTGYFGDSLTVNADINLTANNSYININRATTASDGLLIYKTAGANRWLLGAWGNSNNTFYLYSYGVGGPILTADYATGNIGIGSTSPSAKLNVVGGADVLVVAGSGSTANTTIMAVDGNNGRLFEVSDDLSDSLFSVNTIAGLPVMEAFADNTVVLGAYGQCDLVVTGSKVGIGTCSVRDYSKFEVRLGQSESAKFGSWEVYTYGVNNAWLGENVYFDGSDFRHRAAGYANLLYSDAANGFQIRMTPSTGAAGAVASYAKTFVILPNGNVGIGSTAPAYKLDVAGTIRATGDVIAYSDARIKENVVTLENSLEKVQNLRGVSYNKIGEPEKKIGVIAQEVLEVLPEVVSQDSEGTYSVAYGNITAVLIEAIKEQQKQIDELKQEIKKLKG